MKPLKRKLASSLAVFVLLSAAQLTSAFYDPSLGRWLNRDPIAERGGINLYAYVVNNPIIQFDTLGYFSTGGRASPGPNSIVCQNGTATVQVGTDNAPGTSPEVLDCIRAH